jgi:hypothetical protein
MWPDKDRFDLRVRLSNGMLWEVDVKDHTNPMTIVTAKIHAKDIVVPDYRKDQLEFLRRALPTTRVCTITGFVRFVRSQIADV